MRLSGNNDNSLILFGHHAAISALLQCLGQLSQPITPSLRSGAIGVTAALGIAVGPIYQRGALKNHTIVWIFTFVDVIFPSMAKVLGLPMDHPDGSLVFSIDFVGHLGRLGNLLLYTNLSINWDIKGFVTSLFSAKPLSHPMMSMGLPGTNLC